VYACLAEVAEILGEMKLQRVGQHRRAALVLPGGIQPLPGLCKAIDHPCAVCLLRTEPPAHDADVPGKARQPALTTQVSETNRGQPACGLGHLQPRPSFSHQHVGRQRNPQSHADRVPVNGGNDRLPVHGSREDVRALRAPAFRTAKPLKLLGRSQLPLSDVRPARERPARAAEDGNEGVLILVETTQGPGQRMNQFIGKRVQSLGSLQRQRDDPPVAFVTEEPFGNVVCRITHVRSPTPSEVAGALSGPAPEPDAARAMPSQPLSSPRSARAP
jgi:hypothetical protein